MHVLRPLLLASFVAATVGHAQIPVKHRQGTMRGFLLLKSEQGKVIAVGDLIQNAAGGEVHTELVFHFTDGSLDDDVTVFRQRNTFQLVSDHHIQTGPSFPKPLDIAVDVASSQVTSREQHDGKVQTKVAHMDLPADLANGMMPAILCNLSPATAETRVTYLTGTPAPRTVTLSIKPAGHDAFHLSTTTRKATRFNIHVELGGLASVIAPVIGKQPADLQMWVLGGDVPTFLRLTGPLYLGGPVWTAEQTSPVWPSPN